MKRRDTIFFLKTLFAEEAAQERQHKDVDPAPTPPRMEMKSLVHRLFFKSLSDG